eukprot:CAMPEP_0204359172 /NCGR_PEP_ID=MMETSP0469-20131031/37057_1 /ASSEMBLY_ACC=CAM_ASM_000384 /TAXON_ID=2969 /ORGANISM="Oxyrrhis marina" /LENGTH=407 /DNA_ID=CAMNT_0051347157 /DNA_START=260 /DNA_END=1479 /DNA_ORIENTATION=-
MGNVGGDDAQNDPEAANKAKNVVWLRAGTHFKVKSEETAEASSGASLFEGKIEPKDIAQGALGDCWLLAAMACVAEHDGAIEALFLTKEVDPRGKYFLRLFDPAKEKWVRLVIDDFIPCDAELWDKEQKAAPLFTRPNGNELWVVLLEKAFAKLCGSYANLEGGSTTWALRCMTGDIAREFWLDDSKKKFERYNLVFKDDAKDKRAMGMRKADEEVTLDNMFEMMLKYDKMHSVLSGSGASGESGLHARHAYSILSVKKVKGKRFVKFRNPWGSGEWTGDWSDKSDLWTQHGDIKRALQGKDATPANDGSFWMQWEDVLKHWTRIGIVDRTVDINTVKCVIVGGKTFMGPCLAVPVGVLQLLVLLPRIPSLVLPPSIQESVGQGQEMWLQHLVEACDQISLAEPVVA